MKVGLGETYNLLINHTRTSFKLVLTRKWEEKEEILINLIYIHSRIEKEAVNEFAVSSPYFFSACCFITVKPKYWHIYLRSCGQCWTLSVWLVSPRRVCFPKFAKSHNFLSFYSVHLENSNYRIIHHSLSRFCVAITYLHT